MDMKGQLELQGLWNKVEEGLAGETFDRLWYNSEGKVLMVIKAGEQAEVERQFRQAVGQFASSKNHGSEANKEKAKRKVMVAFEQFLAALDSGHGSGHHDCASGLHVRHRRLDHVKVAVEIGLDGLVEVLLGQIFEPLCVLLKGRVVDENIELAELP